MNDSSRTEATTQPLSDSQRRLIHDLALDARELLTREARELLEGTYGLYPDGRLDPPAQLPQVQSDPEAGETYRRLAQFLDDEVRAGLPLAEAVDKLVKEVAFTHLNRLVAFKMMEARKLIRGTLDKGTESNAFKYYLADPEHAADYSLYQAGDVDTAYRRFLLWQTAQVGTEVRVLFDPANLPSRLFPRPRALQALLAMLNRPDLADAWRADETIGWVYQYFNEPELQATFEKVRISGAKFETRDIPSATQLFTPHWIVRFLVQNTLGRLWVQMHPDTRLLGTELLDYLVPLEGAAPPEPLRLVEEITFLDPACGGMHFGLVAFDLLAAMYREELDRAGEPGWPNKASVSAGDEIAAAIIRNNLFGIDIDLRAVQLSTLALYLKAKSLNPEARITSSNLACADVLPLNGARLGSFLREAHFSRPVYERLIRALWTRLQDANKLGSLLRLEQELGDLIAQERARYAKAPLFAGVSGEFEQAAAEEEFWQILLAQIVHGLDEFTRLQARAGVDQTYFAGEAVKGLRLLDLMLRHYDVVVTNPPYLSRRKMSKDLADLVESAYPDAKGDFYACFIQRCLEFAEERGYVGMLTMHSFMFLATYESLRAHVRTQATITAMAHCGPGLFDVGNPGTLQTTAFTLQREAETARRESNPGTYVRLLHLRNGDAKREALEQALGNGSDIFRVAQHRFDAIPGSPWVYWMRDGIRSLLEALPSLGEVAQPRQGLATADNFRFLRCWWEAGSDRMALGCCSRSQASASGRKWFPCMKGGAHLMWYGNQEHVVNWQDDGSEMRAFPQAFIRNPDLYFREAVTFGAISSKGFSARYMPPGFVFDHGGNCVFAEHAISPAALLGVMNSTFSRAVLHAINPTINFFVDDIKRIPLPECGAGALEFLVRSCIHASQLVESARETTFDFSVPPRWGIGKEHLDEVQRYIEELEVRIDDGVYRLYGISDEDRSALEAEVTSEPCIVEDDGDISPVDGDETEQPQSLVSHDELAARWISYAVGIIVGRFRPGTAGKLGSAVYRRSDFAIGSLPEPDLAEFDRLVGAPDHFAYIDAEGGRHLFPPEVESALRALAVQDGIAVLDEGHARDFPALVERALELMLGEASAREVIAEGAGGNLRAFLGRDFFTKWHLRWYRKRPVYWPLQSARRGYGFVLFHERIDRMTLYTLQRDYLDPKRNGLRLKIADLQGEAASLGGAARKRVERQIDEKTLLLAEVTEFAQAIDRIVRAGYEPEPDWIDDGVILRLAPLWELIPLWKAEPKKYWERLQKGDFDWSHIAMRYWSERVKQACKTNKSFAIAHGHQEWYEGRA
jgi:hypothetical protein